MPRSISPRQKSRASKPSLERTTKIPAKSRRAAPATPVNNSGPEADLDALWLQISSALRGELGDGVFDRWFSTLGLVGVNGREVVLQIPNSIYQVWIESNYGPQLQAALMSVLGAKRKVASASPRAARPNRSCSRANPSRLRRRPAS